MSTEPVLTQHKVTVLLIDDQPMIGEAVRRMLAGEPDIIFHYCRDASRALEEAGRLKPTVILQDLVMPDIDGLTLVKMVRANEPTRETPMIMLSTKEEPAVKAEAFALGANDYIVKLPDRIELLRASAITPRVTLTCFNATRHTRRSWKVSAGWPTR